MLNGVLLTILVAMPLLCGWRATVSRRGLEVNHVTLFTLGFFFYWVLPIVVGESAVFAADPLLGWWQGYYRRTVHPDGLRMYLTFTILIYAAFAVGSRLGSRRVLRDPNTDRTILAFAPGLLVVLLALCGALLAAHGWRLRDEIFTGYLGGAEPDVNGLRRGPVAATSLVLTALLLFRLASDHPHAARRRMRLAAAPFVLCWAAAAVLLLSLGVRLYAITGTLALLAFFSVFRRPLRWRTALVVLAAVVGVAGAVGNVRLGGRISLVTIGASAAMEPLFTSFSLLSFIGQNDFPLWNLPRFLLGDLVNLVPSAVFPGKTEFLLKPEDYGYVVYSPVGALSSFFSFMINFGLLGTMALVAGVGYALAVLKEQQATVARVVYAMVSACLGFTFFRDPFSVALVKNVFQFSILTPLLVATALHVMTVVAASTARRAAVGRPA